MLSKLKFCRGQSRLAKRRTHHEDERLLLVQTLVDLVHGVQLYAVLQPLEAHLGRAREEDSEHARLPAANPPVVVRRHAGLRRAHGRAEPVGPRTGVLVRILQRRLRHLALSKQPVDEQVVALVHALKHRELAAEVVQSVDDGQVGLFEHAQALLRQPGL
jgi:hypothetical protein